MSFFLSIQWMEVVGHLSVRISFNIGVIFQVMVIVVFRIRVSFHYITIHCVYAVV